MAGRLERGIRRRVFRRATPPTADRPPPACPAGWRTGAPDFVGVGVQRAGTSWWFSELRRHPDFAALDGAPKELHFFDPFSNRQLDPADVQRYHEWFPRPEGGVTGEWTPVYVYEPWAVPMLIRAAPTARVLLLLRDPIDRFQSGLALGLSRGFSHVEASLEAYHRGLYTLQVERLLAHVPRAQILVLLYEQLRADPAGARRATAEFVGLDPDRFPRAPDAREPKPKRTAEAHGLTPGLLGEFRARYRAELAGLPALLPELDLGCWPTLADD